MEKNPEEIKSLIEDLEKELLACRAEKLYWIGEKNSEKIAKFMAKDFTIRHEIEELKKIV